MITIEKAIEIIDEQALDLFVRANCVPCELSECEEYDECWKRIDELNDIAKYLRNYKKIKEFFVK